MFPILTLFIIFLLFYAYKRNQFSKQEAAKESAFWERENQANATRKKDIEHLDYITIPLEDFSIGTHPEQQLLELEEQLTALSVKKILNLTGISNTDLKLQYGAANLERLGSFDDNFTALVRLLTDYAAALHELSYDEDAIHVLEFGVKIKSDVTQNYVLLAQLYQEKGEEVKIRSLIEAAGILNSLSKETIQKKLSEII